MKISDRTFLVVSIPVAACVLWALFHFIDDATLLTIIIAGLIVVPLACGYLVFPKLAVAVPKKEELFDALAVKSQYFIVALLITGGIFWMAHGLISPDTLDEEKTHFGGGQDKDRARQSPGPK